MEGEPNAARPAGAEQEEEAGRAVVREALVNRLAVAGLRPRRGVTAAQHAKAMDWLVGHLAYMARDNVDVLAESILTEAAKPGPAQGRWPTELVIRQWAEALQPKPFSEHPIIRSWLRSREGPMAEAGGYLVPLLRWLRKHRRMVGKYDLIQIREEGAEMQRKINAIRDRIDDGREWPEDRAVLESYLRDLREAVQYVDEGSALRTQKAAAGGEGDEVAA